MAQVTASQGPFTAETDLARLSVTVTVSAGRRIRISAEVWFQSTVTTDTAQVNIYEDGTIIQAGRVVANTLSVSPSITRSPSAGTHTYKLTGQRATGTGNITMFASITTPGEILVEDIGT